jgi:hypothetical protein
MTAIESTGLTPKQEAFARHYAAGGNGAAAARAAGYSAASAKQIACQTLQLPDVDARVRELQARFAATARREVAVLLDGLEDALDWARQARDYRAIVDITRLKARLTGLLDARPDARVNSPAMLYDEAGPGPLERAQLGWPAEGGPPDLEAEHDLALPSGDGLPVEMPAPPAGPVRHLDLPLPFPPPSGADPAGLVCAALAECRKEGAMAA